MRPPGPEELEEDDGRRERNKKKKWIAGPVTERERRGWGVEVHSDWSCVSTQREEEREGD